jgi:hypothetical protein
MTTSEKYGFDGVPQNKRLWRLFYDCSKGVKGFVQEKNSIVKKMPFLLAL